MGPCAVGRSWEGIVEDMEEALLDDDDPHIFRVPNVEIEEIASTAARGRCDTS